MAEWSFWCHMSQVGHEEAIDESKVYRVEKESRKGEKGEEKDSEQGQGKNI